MHADHDQFIREFCFQLLQFGENVHAVDAAEGPKVEEHELALQILLRERLGVEPIDSPRHFRALEALIAERILRRCRTAGEQE